MWFNTNRLYYYNNHAGIYSKIGIFSTFHFQSVYNMKTYAISLVPHEKYYTALLYAAMIRTRTHQQTAHAPYTCILGRVA